MKITLVNPPVEDFFSTGLRRQPLGLLYIASSLRGAGYDPELLNCHTPKKQVLDIPAELGYLREFINHPDPELRFPFANYAHYGMSWGEIEKRIRDSRSDLYLVSSLFTTYYRETERIINLIRRYSPGAAVAAGGYHPTLHTGSFLKSSGTDYVIRGEGEIAAVKLADILNNGGSAESIPGVISVKTGGDNYSSMAESPDVRSLRYSARDLLMQRDFKAYRKIFVSMITSRGCPNRCEFCTGKTVWGNRYRSRGSDDVMREISECAEKSGAEIINFEDDNLFPSKKRAHEFLEAIIAMKEKTGSCIEFTAMNGVSLENIDEDIVRLMRHAGFNDLNISLVTQSAEVQAASGRPFNSDRFRRIAQCAKKEGMHVRGYFILGMPGQSMSEIEDTISFMKGLGIAVFPSVFYNVFSPEGEWKMQRSSAFYNETPDLSRRDLLRFFNLCSRGI